MDPASAICWNRDNPFEHLGGDVNGIIESTASQRDDHAARPRVLVVDDDRSNSEIVSRVLAAHGFAVDTAPNGQAALELVKQHPYRLAVVDYQMPGMNGVEFFRSARELQPELRGVFLTAYANISTVFPAIEAGVERVLAKPLNSRELIHIADALTAPGRLPNNPGYRLGWSGRDRRDRREHRPHRAGWGRVMALPAPRGIVASMGPRFALGDVRHSGRSVGAAQARRQGKRSHLWHWLSNRNK